MSHHQYHLYALTIVRVDGSIHVDTINARDVGEAIALWERIEERHNPDAIAVDEIIIDMLNTPSDDEE